MEEIIKLIREKEEREGRRLTIVIDSDCTGYVTDYKYNDDILEYFENEQELIEWLKN